MRLARRSQIQQLDEVTMWDKGVSAEDLMELAGSRMADKILNQIPWDQSKPAWIFCGPGNNGGDGQVIARQFTEAGRSVHSWVFGDRLPSVKDLKQAGLVVDALFGVGLDRELEGAAFEVVQRINSYRGMIVAIDIPSGLDADRGIVMGAAVQAKVTLTVELAKPGLFLQEGPLHAGRIQIISLDFDREAKKKISSDVFLAGAKLAQKIAPKPKPKTANKTNFGRTLVIGGSKGMEGAAVLSASAAARSGVGYVTLCTPKALSWDRRPADFLSMDWKDLAGKDSLEKFDSILIGPGLNEKDLPKNFLHKLLEQNKKTILDAGIFQQIAKEKIQLHKNCVITPHAGELSRLIPISAKEIEDDRLTAVRRSSESLNVNTLLKGFHTIVDDGAKSFIIASGNIALAKAGTGDVLAGFIAGIAAQGLAIREAAVYASYIHGAIADEWIRSGRGQRTLLASDLPEWYKLISARNLKGSIA